MKNHEEMFKALLAGEALVTVDGVAQRRLIDGDLINQYGGVVGSFGGYAPGNWKIIPKTININGFDVPEPLRELPEKGTAIYVVDFNVCGNYRLIYANNQEQYILEGLAHLTSEAAVVHANALISFTRKLS